MAAVMSILMYLSKLMAHSGSKTFPGFRRSNLKFQVCEDEKVGRHLVATRDIKPGDVVLKEAPLIWGPAQVTVPVCLGCGKTVTEENSRPCTKCGWPVCSEKCENSASHKPECYYTVQAGKRVTDVKRIN